MYLFVSGSERHFLTVVSIETVSMAQILDRSCILGARISKQTNIPEICIWSADDCGPVSGRCPLL